MKASTIIGGVGVIILLLTAGVTLGSVFIAINYLTVRIIQDFVVGNSFDGFMGGALFIVGGTLAVDCSVLIYLAQKLEEWGY